MGRGDRTSVLALLADGAAHAYGALAQPLLRALEASRAFDLDVARHHDALGGLGRHRVLLAASDGHLSAAEAEAVSSFVRAGGGLIMLHGTLGGWSRHPALAEVAGWVPSGPGPATELVLTSHSGHPITDRLAPEFRLHDELYLSEGPPSGAAVLVSAQWHFSQQPVAFARPFGQGRVVHLSLGHGAATYQDPTFQKLVYRSLRWAAGVEPAPPVGAGLVGYGAVARGHADSIARTPGLELRGVADLSAERRARAEVELGVATHATAAGLLRDPEVELLVVGTPPDTHAGAVLEALDLGRHVVCEKPFALRVEEVDRMLDAARQKDRVITAYQSRRWDPDFVALKQAVRAGALGQLFYMESFIGGYSHPCGYWHSHEPVSGGTIYDWGSHYFDWVLQLLPQPVRAVTAVAQKRVWHDVSNSDQVRVDLTFEDGAQATFLQSDIAAALKPKWYLLGTGGALVGEWRLEKVQSRDWSGDLVEEALQPAESPARLRVFRPAGDGQSHVEELALPAREPDGFYRNLADHLLLGEPLAVLPEEARRTVAVMEAAARSIAAGGKQLEVSL